MDIQIELDRSDWRSYQAHVEKALPRRLRGWTSRTWFHVLVWFVIGLFFSIVFNELADFHWPTAAALGIVSALLASLYLFNVARIRKAFEPSESGSFCGVHHFRLSEQGIESEGFGYRAIYEWKIVKRLERTRGLILVYIDTVYALVFPESKLEDPDAFYRFITERTGLAIAGTSGHARRRAAPHTHRAP